MVVDRPERRVVPFTARALGIGLVATLAGALFAFIATTGVNQVGTAVAVLMLAVTIAAVVGGLWAGVVAAVLASAALPAIEWLRLQPGQYSPSDLISAAVVFLAIAVVVGLVVGNAADERDRAARSEREARLLAYLSTKLLSGDVPDRVLDEFVMVLLEPLGLASCHVAVSLDGHAIEAKAERDGLPPGGPTEVIPIVVANIPLGTLIAERPAGRRAFNRDERMLLEAATRQAAVALDRARLDARARLAQVDAETNQLRAAMFSSVTHDLRTPLASIKAGVTSLLDEDATHDEGQERDLLVTILEETDRLNRLVGNILDLAKIRAGALISRRVPTAVDEVAEAVVARMRPRLGDVVIDLQLAPDLPDIPADPMQLDQVLTNLLENAARHSPTGGTIRIHATQTERAVRLRIADEGPGIHVDDREKVFEAFYRGRQSPESPGSGLGLSIARAIVTAHGGRIWVEETMGGGTAMVLDMPIQETGL
ncbi:MAG TPA: ATP-binding protein [Actinomycetota bacterium]|nr:ATP-binding protein [Actinomycetota bacterium]